MKHISNLAFQFKGKEYYAIVRMRHDDEYEKIIVRIMNHTLDLLLSSNSLNVYERHQGRFLQPGGFANVDQRELYNLIMSKLEHLQETSPYSTSGGRSDKWINPN